MTLDTYSHVLLDDGVVFCRSRHDVQYTRRAEDEETEPWASCPVTTSGGKRGAASETRRARRLKSRYKMSHRTPLTSVTTLASGVPIDQRYDAALGLEWDKTHNKR